MKSLHLLLAAALLPLGFTATHGAPASLAYMPLETEVAIGLDEQQLAKSPLVLQIVKKRLGDQLDSKVAFIETLTGTNVMKDLTHVTFFGRVNNDNSMALMVEGKLDRAKLLTLVKVNESYRTFQQDGREIHEWMDKDEQRLKFGCFVADNTVIIWNSKDAMDAGLGAMAAPEKSLAKSADAATIPAEADTAAAWAVLFSRNPNSPGAKLHVAKAFAWANLELNDVVAHATITADSPTAGAQWADLAKGAAALGQLQSQNAVLANLASHAKVTPSADGNAVAVEASLDNATVLAIVEKGGIK